jgi:hypothetical protein
MKSVGAEPTDLRLLSGTAWFERIRNIGNALGSFERLGLSHASLYAKGSSTLLVTFETVDTIRKTRKDQLPLGLGMARARGWSQLCLIAERQSWYRDASVYAFFDRLVDDCFFDAFDSVVFYGAGMCGYAAAAFSVASPGATVVAVQPQATLDPRIAGWDPRWPEMRRTSFTDRYGFAPDMTEGAAQVFVVFDPEQSMDSMHAALFARPYTTLLPCRNLGRDNALALDGMHVLHAMLTAAANRTLDEPLFRTFYRSRRNFAPYLRNLLARLDNEGRMILSGILCRNVANRLQLSVFEERLAEIEARLARMGEKLPDGLF